MSFTIPLFVGFGLIAALMLRHLRSRTAFLVAANLLNLGFILLFFGTFALAILIGIALFGLAVIRLGQRYGTRVIAPGLALVVTLFVVIKQYPFVPRIEFLSEMGAVVGVSYIVFRLVHMIVDTSEKSIEKVGTLEYLNFILSFFTLLSGPIARFQDMQNWRAVEDVTIRDLLRVGWGLLKVAVISPPILALHEGLLAKATATAAAGSLDASGLIVVNGATIFAGAAWFVFLYFNFGGYMDIVIGLGRVAGVALPENFNRPFRANSFLQFWNRWHMTLSFWFRTYVFSPLFKWLYHRHPPSRAIQTHVSLFMTFLLVGAWHGTTWSFVICGLILAIGAVVNEIYPKLVTRLIGKPRLKTLNGNFFYQCLCFGLTFAFLSVAFLPFWMPEKQYFSFLGYYASLAGALVFLLLWGVAVAYIAVFRLAEGVAVPLTVRLIAAADRVLTPDRVRLALLAITVNIIILVGLLNYGQVQSFVYQTY